MSFETIKKTLKAPLTEKRYGEEFVTLMETRSQTHVTLTSTSLESIGDP